VGYDPYREEARRMLRVLTSGAAFVVGLVLHLLISPHLEALPTLGLAVAGGLTAEVLLLLLLRRGRSSAVAAGSPVGRRPAG
jgi:hypothetical protein